jgi:16S rRNA C967 or C1407 C5-methylase (RsmB/RsmF family)
MDRDRNDTKRNKRKRQRDANNNPLAVARGGKAKKQNKAETLWHKRSGIGYRLFVEYYRQQPAGVVAVPASADDTTSTNNNISSGFKKQASATTRGSSKPNAAAAATAASGGGGAGQSRAAKRRKKKQDQQQLLQNGGGSPETALAAVSATTSTTPQAAQHHDASLETTVATTNSIHDNNDHPLLEALRQDGHPHHTDTFEEFLVALSKTLPLSFRIRNGISSSVRQELTSYIQEHFSQLVAPVRWGGNEHQIYQAKPLLVLKSTTTSSSTSSQVSSKSTSSSSNVLSKSNLSHVSPALKQFLQQRSVDGTLARQEVGSMLPVLGLHHGGWLSKSTSTTSLRVLDMCASPGSKTLQVLELLQHQQQQQQESTRNGNKQPRIVIKANDVNATRLETLRQAVERSNVLQVATTEQNNNNNNNNGDRGSKSSSIIKYTNFDASQYPIPTTTTLPINNKAYNVILCDVPCSGDGTIRKDGHILPNWTPATSHALHQLQVNILYRALSCLQAKNGIVSYSTCSLNPIENEAVVAAAILKARQTGLRQQNGRGRHAVAAAAAVSNDKMESSGSRPIVELVDWPEMPSAGFIRRPGVLTWKVADYVGHAVDEDDDQDHQDALDGNHKNEQRRQGGGGGGGGLLRWHATYQDAVQAQMEYAVPTMWPPPRPTPPTTLPAAAREMEKNGCGGETIEGEEAEDSSSLHMERCVRLLPQDHDTGGFFVALIRRNF